MNERFEQIQGIMKNPNNIRNISVIAHVDHGKTSLTDGLLQRAGVLNTNNAGNVRSTDTMNLEKEKGITIKSTGVSMVYELQQQQNEESKQQQYNEPYLINLIDSPGHVDFSSEVTAALRVTDGALVVVDFMDGVCVQTETVLRQACKERIRATLVINKLDRAILEKQLDGEQIYNRVQTIIADVNYLLQTYLPQEMVNEIDPLKGNVALAAGRECWGFTLPQIARMIAKPKKLKPEVLLKKIWGESYYNPGLKKFQKEQFTEQGLKLKRGFVQFVMDPIIDLHKKLVQENDRNFAQQLAKSQNIEISQVHLEQTNQALLKYIMSSWMHSGDALFEMIINHLPSPKDAMKYRTQQLYEGPQDDDISRAMRSCDADGPLIMYVSKMVPNNDYSKFYAFGRVFSGTLRTGQKVQIMGPNYKVGGKEDLFFKNITMPVIMMGKKMENVNEVPCGNTCAILGIDNFLTKTGTISDHPQAHCIKSMKYSVSPVVRVAVQTKNPQDVVKLINGMKKLQKSDNLVQCTIDESTGQNIIAGAGELHIEICLDLLKNEFAKCELIISDPIVSYKETVTQKSEQGLSKSSNGHNRLWGTVEPISEELCTAIESGKISFGTPQISEQLVAEFDWDRDETKKLWMFGPQPTDSNIIVDNCSQVQGMGSIKDSILQGFKWSTYEGVLTHEQTRGIKVNLEDAKIHSDNVHRGTGQILPMARSLIYGNCLNASPSILEPIFLCEISVPLEGKNGVYNLLNKRRGYVFEEEIVENSPLWNLKAYLPVEESFGFDSALRQATQGQAFPQCMFDHWQIVQGDLDDAGSKLRKLVDQIRQRKGINSIIPVAQDYLKKL